MEREQEIREWAEKEERYDPTDDAVGFRLFLHRKELLEIVTTLREQENEEDVLGQLGTAIADLSECKAQCASMTDVVTFLKETVKEGIWPTRYHWRMEAIKVLDAHDATLASKGREDKESPPKCGCGAPYHDFMPTCNCRERNDEEAYERHVADAGSTREDE